MDRMIYRQELAGIQFIQDRYDRLNEQSKKLIQELKACYNENNITTGDIVENMFEFSYLGNHFIVKAETLLSLDYNAIEQGELSTYLKIHDKERPILSYKFDSIGNIESRYTIRQFGVKYLIDFTNEFIKFSNSNNFKIALR